MQRPQLEQVHALRSDEVVDRRDRALLRRYRDRVVRQHGAGVGTRAVVGEPLLPKYLKELLPEAEVVQILQEQDQFHLGALTIDLALLADHGG